MFLICAGDFWQSDINWELTLSQTCLPSRAGASSLKHPTPSPETTVTAQERFFTENVVPVLKKGFDHWKPPMQTLFMCPGDRPPKEGSGAQNAPTELQLVTESQESTVVRS